MTTFKLKENFLRLSSEAKILAEEFLNMSYTQINWRAADSQWSIGECFEHLIRTNEKYITVYEKYKLHDQNDAHVHYKQTLIGGFIIKSVMPDNGRKFKTSSSFNPIGSSINENIVTNFIKQNDKLIDLTENIDPLKIRLKISSPFAKFIKYNIGDSLLVIGNHNLRHLNQAKRVMQNKKFPAA
jgi:hypothetical protein